MNRVTRFVWVASTVFYLLVILPYGIGLPFDPARGLWNSPMNIVNAWGRDGLFFQMEHKVYHGKKLGHILIHVPTRELLHRAQAIFEAASEAIDKLPPAMRASLLPKLNRLKSNVDAFSPFVLSKADQEKALKRAKRSLRMRRQANRVKRSGWSINFDPATMFSSLFSGIRSLMNAPSLKAIKAQMGKIFHEVKKQAVFQEMLGKRTVMALQLIKQSHEEFDSEFGQLAMSDRISNALDVALDSSDLLLECAMAFSKGNLCRLVNPREIFDALKQLQLAASSDDGLRLLLGDTNVMDIFALPTTVVTTDQGDWSVIVHVPMIEENKAFIGYSFINAPFFNSDNEPVEFVTDSGLLAITDDLKEDQEHMFIPSADIDNKCVLILSKMVCSSVTVHRNNMNTCPASLLTSENPDSTWMTKARSKEALQNGFSLENKLSCFTRPRTTFFNPVPVGDYLVLFVDKSIDIRVTCENSEPRQETVVGRKVLELDPGCLVVTTEWYFHMPDTSGRSTTLVRVNFNLMQIPYVDMEEWSKAPESVHNVNLTSIFNSSVHDVLQDLRLNKTNLALNTTKAVLTQLIEVAQDEIDELSVNQTATVELLNTVASRVDDLDAQDEEWDDGDVASISVSGVGILLVGGALLFLYRRANPPQA